MRFLLVSTLVLALCIPTLFAEGSGELITDDVDPASIDAAFITSIALPTVESIVTSLEAQSAPVPRELTRLLKFKDNPTAFIELATRYFGDTWRDSLSEQPEDTTASDAPLLRAQLYLYSLRQNSDDIARWTTIEEEEITTKINALLDSLSAIETDDARSEFVSEFTKFTEDLFTRDTPTLDAFRTETRTLLADTVDAAAILMGNETSDAITPQLAELQSRLPLVTGSREMAGWLSEFDALTERLSPYFNKNNLTLVTADAIELLEQLNQYLEKNNDEINETLTKKIHQLITTLQTASSPVITTKALDDVRHLFLRLTAPPSIEAP